MPAASRTTRPPPSESDLGWGSTGCRSGEDIVRLFPPLGMGLKGSTVGAQPTRRLLGRQSSTGGNSIGGAGDAVTDAAPADFFDLEGHHAPEREEQVADEAPVVVAFRRDHPRPVNQERAAL